MMKRKFLAVILPIIGCATVVGSGFSAWYFSDNFNGDTVNSTITTVVTEDGNNKPLGITIKHDFTNGDNNKNCDHLILDQGGFQNSELEKGISLGGANDNSATDDTFVWSAEIAYSDDNITLKDLGNGNINLEFTLDIIIEDGLDDYIEVKTGAPTEDTYTNQVIQYVEDNELGDKPTYSFTDYFKNVDNVTTNEGYSFNGTKYSSVHTIDAKTLIGYGETTNRKKWYVYVDFRTQDLVNSIFKYKEGKKPTSITAYNNGLGATENNPVANKRIQLRISATLVDGD